MNTNKATAKSGLVKMVRSLLRRGNYIYARPVRGGEYDYVRIQDCRTVHGEFQARRLSYGYAPWFAAEIDLQNRS